MIFEKNKALYYVNVRLMVMVTNIVHPTSTDSVDVERYGFL